MSQGGGLRASYLRFQLDPEAEDTDDGGSDLEDGEDEERDRRDKYSSCFYPLMVIIVLLRPEDTNPELADLSNTRLKTLTLSQLPGLQQLRFLYLSHNRLPALPPDLLSSAPCIQWLDVRSNPLASLPPLCGHQSIKVAGVKTFC